MESVPDQQTGGHEREFDLADVSHLRLTELISSSDAVLANSVRRVLLELNRPEDPVATFGNVP